MNIFNKYIVLLFLLICIYFQANSKFQNDLKAFNDTSEENILQLNKKATATAEFFPDTSLKYSLLAFKLSKKIKDPKLQQISLKNIAIAHKNMGNNNEALSFFKIYLDLCKKNKDVDNEIETLNSIGELYRLFGLLDLSFESHFISLKLANENKKEQYFPLIYNNIGVIYRNIGDVNTARFYYNKALTIGYKQNNYLSISKSYQNIGNLFWYNNLYDSALFQYNKALSTLKQINDNPLSVKAELINNIGNVYRSKKEYEKAINYYNTAINLCKKINNKNIEAVILKNTGNAYYFKGNSIKAINYLNQSNLIAKRINLKRILIENHYQLSEIYAKAGNYKLSLDNFKDYVLLKDSVFLNEKNIKISELELKYKNKENEELINKLKYNKQKSNLLYTSIIAIISFLLLIATYSQYKMKKIDNKKIEEQSLVLKQLNKELKTQNEQLQIGKEQLSDSETLFRTIFEDSPLGKVLLDAKGNILKINDTFLKIVGLEVNKELLSLNIFQLSVLKRTQILTSFSEAIETKNIVYGEDTIRNAKLNHITIDYHISPIFNKDGEIIKIQIVVNDISEKQKREKALIKSEQKLRELNATKDKFFSIIAHDIKNPFNAIMGFSNLLKEDYQSFTDEERMQFIRNISQASEDVYNLLENLLKWSWTQSGNISFNPKPVNILDICNETFAVTKLQAERKNIIIESSISESIIVYADENMVKAVFRNLISNAIKFTNDNGIIKLTHLLTEKRDKTNKILNKYIQIQIEDNGVGISEEDLLKLFKIEEKINSKGTKGETGTGLGLILCKEFIEKNRGEIWAKSEIGKGSCFIFTIPIK